MTQNESAERALKEAAVVAKSELSQSELEVYGIQKYLENAKEKYNERLKVWEDLKEYYVEPPNNTTRWW